MGEISGDEAAGHLLRNIFGAPGRRDGPPFTHTLRLPETEAEMAAEPPPSFTLDVAACTCDPGPEGQHQWYCGLPRPTETGTCAHCGATGELQWTVYDRWQCADLSGCTRRQLAAREAR